MPRKTVLELGACCPKAKSPCACRCAANQVRFTFGSIEFVSKLVEGKFPDYAKVVPANNPKTFLIDRAELMQACRARRS